jgi:hypothetical protein
MSGRSTMNSGRRHSDYSLPEDCPSGSGTLYPPLAIASATLFATTMKVVTTSEITLLPRRILTSESIRPKRVAIRQRTRTTRSALRSQSLRTGWPKQKAPPVRPADLILGDHVTLDRRLADRCLESVPCCSFLIRSGASSDCTACDAFSYKVCQASVTGRRRPSPCTLRPPGIPSSRPWLGPSRLCP